MCELREYPLCETGEPATIPTPRSIDSSYDDKAASWPIVLTTVLALLFTALTCIPVFAQSNGLVKPSGQTPPHVLDGTAPLVAHYESSQMLRLAIVLAPPHPTEEHQFLEDVQNKQSPLFHQYLSGEDWNTRFGPTAEAEQAVVDWAKSQGLTVTHRYNNRLLVDVEAQSGTIEKALHVTINNYRVPTVAPQAEGRVAFSNDRDPVLPAELDGVVQAVLGLNSFEGMQPASGSGRLVPRPDYVPGPVVQSLDSVQKDAKAEAVAALADKSNLTPEVTPPPAGYWKPTDMYSSYAYDYGALMDQGHCCNPLNNTSGHSPRESSIAIAAFGDVNSSDLVGFQAAFPYLAVYVDKIGIDGGYTCSGSGDDNCFETTLDTEWSLAMANSEGAASDTARVVVYEGSNYITNTIADVYNQMIDDAHARTMSTSWACAENIYYNSQLNCYNSTMQSIDNILSTMAGQGWTLIAASGDQGSTGNCDDALRVEFPSSDPNVIAAGGTELSEGNPYEVAWTGGTSSGSCNSNGGGGTGGFSEYFGVPSYQSFLGFSKRSTPDISLDAFYGHDIYYFGGWAHPGGTSDVAPMLAGFFAQENAYLLSLGDKCGSATAACAPIGNANYPIYREAEYKNAAHYPFYDITVGCTSNDITAEFKLTPWCAKTGYDETTGWGSANMLQLAWSINWYTAAASGIPYTTFTGPAINKWYNNGQVVSWNVVDYAGGTSGVPGTGIAGFTQGWDSIPSDPGSEAHGGTGNSFYSGPQYTNVSTGCLSLASGGACAGGVSQGCHTAHVRGWNNQGMTTGDTTYGPICYDTVAPTVSISDSPVTPASGWYNKSVTISLGASDPGGSNASGISKIYYAINTGACSPSNLGACSVYGSPITISTQGYNYIYYFSEDKAGNFSSEPYQWADIDTAAPVAAATLTGSLNSGTYYSAVKVALSATDNLSGVKSIFYQLDGGATVTYSAPFSVSALGSHTVKYWAVDVAGNTESPLSVSFKVAAQVSQTINFPAITATEDATSSLTLSATASSGLPVTFTSLTPSVCTVSANKASLLVEGTCSVKATQAGNAEYLAASAVSRSFTVHLDTQTITFPAITAEEYAASTLALSAHASSGLAVKFTSLTSSICTVSGSTASLLSSGTCTIQASQAGNNVYGVATDVNQSFTVHKANQTITFATIGTEVAGSSVSLSAKASSDLAVTLTSLTPTVCKVTGTTASLLIAGTCEIQASQAGNTVYNAAADVDHSFTVNHESQTITFASIGTEVAGSSVSLSAKASSDLAVTLTSLTPTVCKVTGTTASLLIAGTCEIQASQAGNTVYGAAADVDRSFTVNHESQTISFSSIAAQVAGGSASLTAHASSGLAVTLTSLTPTVCKVTGTTASLLIAGTCTIQASQAGNTVYGAAADVNQSFTVNHKSQTITFPAIAAQVVGTPLSLKATASSALAVSFTSTTTSICTVSGTTASMLKAGTCTIEATQAGNSEYAAATAVNQSFTVAAK
jgi:hypothetical protein